MNDVHVRIRGMQARMAQRRLPRAPLTLSSPRVSGLSPRPTGVY